LGAFYIRLVVDLVNTNISVTDTYLVRNSMMQASRNSSGSNRTRSDRIN